MNATSSATDKKADKTVNDNVAGSESEQVAKMIHEAIDRFAARAAEAEQRIKEAAADAQTKVAATKRTAKLKSEQAVTAAESYVDQHPWAALGIAFGAGIIISSLLRR